MSDRYPGKFSKTGGKCLAVILANFQKWEENIRLSSWQMFKNGRKMSNRHPGKFQKQKENVILVNFKKREEIVRLSTWQKFKRWEENVQPSS